MEHNALILKKIIAEKHFKEALQEYTIQIKQSGWWENGYPKYFAKVLNAPNWIGINEINGENLI
jgi:hypothetical protein